MPSVVIKQVSTWTTTQPASAASLYLKIQFDGHGYWLLAEESEGGYCLDCWHPSLAKAEQTAKDQFGVGPDDWETVAVS
ncbi:MAG: hypothetical protein AAF766_06500 [Cyanobacteria bacterium P01_D01_bin.14]